MDERTDFEEELLPEAFDMQEDYEPEEDAAAAAAAIPGTLYIVATPIGNSRDMSARGIQILTECDMIAAEDTRRSMVLLNKLGIRNRLVSNHKFNEYGKAKYFINELKNGKSVAVKRICTNIFGVFY